jgi:starch-binding outer membrane protein, SusD/RagB family
MKKITYLIFLMVLAFTSCEDATNIIQDGEVNDEVTFTSTGQMRLYLMEAYDKIDATTNASNGVGVSSILTDEVGIGRGGSVSSAYRFNVFTDNGYSSAIWQDNYTVINYCNRIIRGAGLVSPIDAADQLAYNDVLAQARALRAYSHLQLLTYFSPDMKNDNALGVILMDRVPTLLERLPRNTNGEVFGLIESDLNYAYANIQSSLAPATKPWTYVSKGMINAVRARMYAYRGNYALAEQYATSAIADSGVTLANGTTYTTSALFYAGAGSNNQYKKMFQDLDRGEMIWSVGRSAGKTSIGSIYAVNLSATSGVTLYDMNRNLFNILNNNGGAIWDVRRYVNIDQPTIVNDPNYLTSTNYQTSDNLPIDKYSGIVGTGNALINDIKAFRVSEMVLIQAEGRVFAGDLTGAATLIKSIRDKRSISGPRPLPVYANATDAWGDILDERRVELCFEGHRYIDLKRLGVLANRSIDRHPLDCSTYSLATCSIPATDYRFTLPIPLNELSGNPTIQQNPGY